MRAASLWPRCSDHRHPTGNRCRRCCLRRRTWGTCLWIASSDGVCGPRALPSSCFYRPDAPPSSLTIVHVRHHRPPRLENAHAHQVEDVVRLVEVGQQFLPRAAGAAMNVPPLPPNAPALFDERMRNVAEHSLLGPRKRIFCCRRDDAGAGVTWIQSRSSCSQFAPMESYTSTCRSQRLPHSQRLPPGPQ